MRNALRWLIPVFTAKAGGRKDTALITGYGFLVKLYAVQAVHTLRLNIAAEKHVIIIPFVFSEGALRVGAFCPKRRCGESVIIPDKKHITTCPAKQQKNVDSAPGINN